MKTEHGSGSLPTWATVLLSALGGAVVGALATALLMRRGAAPVAGIPVTTAAPLPPPLPVALPAAEASPPRPRRSRRRRPAPEGA